MTAKSLLIAGALTLCSLGVLSAKSFSIMLANPAMAGNVELKPGEYTLQLQGSQAIFKQVEGTKSFKVPVKVENGSAKYPRTTIESTTAKGMDTIHAIDLADSTTKLDFGQ